MSFTIAITGKGGVGKTTIAGLLVARLIARGCQPVLAVDADPNTCLDAALGVRATTTIGGVREEARQIATAGQSAGVSKQELLTLKIGQSLVEAKDFDLIAMGRPEGPGCYCYANNVLKDAIQQIAASYPYVVIDNEAGLENLSRRIVQRVDLMIMVADPSRRGLETVLRLHQLAEEMDIRYARLAIVVNRLRNGQLGSLAEELREKTGADFIIPLGDDDELAEFNERGGSYVDLSATNAVSQRLDEFLSQLSLVPAVRREAGRADSSKDGEVYA